ncbi:hypothetical protein [Haloferax prahovense]|uniref:hypothetical protein n=1 Tax=Haloferax prahovense TaxID=381852 RepID=UPI0006790680|nr:hypothetical protein [Haloferax prahovense]
MTDERLLTAAKLYEQVRGRIDGDHRLLDHAGLPVSKGDHANLSFLNSLDLTEDDELADSFAETSLGRLVDSSLRTQAATRAVQSSHATALSYLVGVTQQDLDASSLTLPLRLVDELENGGGLTTITGAGNPNTGKTNTMFLLNGDLARAHFGDDLLVISNVGTWDGADIVVRSMYDLMDVLLTHRERPKTVTIDEGSTHFDARTFSREVASQWTPAIKRFSKLGVESVGVVSHTGKDVHPEQKRLSTLSFYKEAQDEVTFYRDWDADSDSPDGELFGGSLVNLEPTLEKYDPDDAAPWAWNLPSDLFQEQFEDWTEFHDILLSMGDTI